ncbi:MAG: cbb3-type cytochrome c oxidase subunit I [Acidimicrobiia bacterium]|nr:cbb3-type cytochrome c oxidase subunit I [Acidimicrobiia bacterium]
MTATETHAAAADEHASASPAGSPTPQGLAGILSSSDHKTLGRMWILASLLLGGFVLVCGLLLHIERANLPGLEVFAGIESFRQFFTLYRVGLVFLFVMPLWIGLATHVVPLQIGARGVAFPRAAAAAFWGWLTGAGILIASWAIDGGLAAGGEQRAVELSLLSFAMVVLSLLGATAVLLTTMCTQRPAGMSLERMPLFSWSVFVAGAVWLLSLPVLVANLVVMWIDLRGPSAVRFGAGQNLYEQVSWVFDQPQVFVFAIPVIGVVGEILPVAFGTPQRRWGVMLSLIGLAGVFSFGADLQRFFSPMAQSTPLYVVSGVVVILVVVALLGGWADLGRSAGRFPRPSGHLAVAMSALGVLVFAAIVGFIRVLGGAVGFLRSFARHNESWQGDLDRALAPLDDLRGTMAGAGLLDLVAMAAVLGAVAGMFYWSPKIFGRRASHAAGFGVAAILGAAGLLMGLMGLVAGFLGQPERPSANFATAGAEVAAILAVIGVIGVLLALAIVLIVALRGASSLARGASTVPDPWGGHTLEWFAASPPPLDNFGDEPVAPVRSAHPLWDAPAPSRSEGGAS